MDENGILLEATYPKRARGLVKNGRARYVDEFTICLARRDHTEDASMQNNEKTAISADFTTTDILQRMDQILSNQSHLQDALSSLKELASNVATGQVAMKDGSVGGLADAMARVVNSRENTYRESLDLLGKMYQDLRPYRSPVPEEMERLEGIMKAIERYTPEQQTEMMKKALQQMMVKPDTAPVI